MHKVCRMEWSQFVFVLSVQGCYDIVTDMKQVFMYGTLTEVCWSFAPDLFEHRLCLQIGIDAWRDMSSMQFTV